MASYRDRWIECTAEAIRIRGYYFPWGTRRIPYMSIRSGRRVDIGTFTGNGRIWGTTNPGYWASLEPGRPGKKVGLILDLGRPARPFLIPDDPDAVEGAIRERTDLGPAKSGGRGPIV